MLKEFIIGEIKKNANRQQGVYKMQAISGLGNFTVSIQLHHRGTMTMFQPPALYQPPAVVLHWGKIQNYFS
jgi:hypothetical protein